MCFCENTTIYNPFYDGKYFSDGDKSNGLIIERGDNIIFEAIRANGEIHERGDEEPTLTEMIVAQNETKPTVIETKPIVVEKWVCENCNLYKPAEIEKYGEIYACKNCRGKLSASATEKSQLSLFWEQGSLF